MRTQQEIVILPISTNLDLTFKTNVEGTLSNFRDAIYTNMIIFADDYDPAVTYKYNYLTRYLGVLYLYINSTPSAGHLPTDATYWIKVTESGKSITPHGDYDNAETYGVLDMVFYNGKAYLCTVTESTGHLPTDITYWYPLTVEGPQGDIGPRGIQGEQGVTGPAGINPRDAYDAGTAYVVNDIVTYNGSAYRCKLATTGHAPTNATYWSIFVAQGSSGSGTGDMLKSVYDADGDGHIDEVILHLNNGIHSQTMIEVRDVDPVEPEVGRMWLIRSSVILGDNFTGANGDPIDSTKWDVVTGGDTGSTGAISIQNNSAQLSITNPSVQYGWAHFKNKAGAILLSTGQKVKAKCTFAGTADQRYCGMAISKEDNTGKPSGSSTPYLNAIEVFFGADGAFALQKKIAGVVTVIGTTASGLLLMDGVPVEVEIITDGASCIVNVGGVERFNVSEVGVDLGSTPYADFFKFFSLARTFTVLVDNVAIDIV